MALNYVLNFQPQPDGSVAVKEQVVVLINGEEKFNVYYPINQTVSDRFTVNEGDNITVNVYNIDKYGNRAQPTILTFVAQSIPVVPQFSASQVA